MVNIIHALRQCLIPALLAAGLAGCSLKQVLHSFPEGAEQSLSPCDDCRLLEVRQEAGSYVMRDAISGEPYQAFAYHSGAIEVKKSGLIFRTIDVEQTDNLTYRGKRYQLQARHHGSLSDPELSRIELIRETPPPAIPLGHIDLANQRPRHITGQIAQQRFSYRRTTTWPAASQRRRENNATVWHQYPPGFLAVVETETGWVAELLQGVEIDKFMGLDAYSRPLYKLQLKPLPDAHLEEAVILFLFAALLADEFNNSLFMVFECLDMSQDDRAANECSHYGVP